MNESTHPRHSRPAGLARPRLAWLRAGAAGVACLSVLVAARARASFFATFPSGTLSASIPDGSAVGFAHDQLVTGMLGSITSVSVFLDIAASGADPMFIGDIYVTLTHDSGFSVRVNRVGRRDGFLAGYGDSGFSVTLADSAAADIHGYRLTLNGSHLIPLGDGETPTGLTGSWQPDGRNADPVFVTEGTVRSAGLSVFEGLDPNGVWTVFVADMSPGAAARLVS